MLPVLAIAGLAALLLAALALATLLRVPAVCVKVRRTSRPVPTSAPEPVLVTTAPDRVEGGEAA
jgi:hypothetical protein